MVLCNCFDNIFVDNLCPTDYFLAFKLISQIFLGKKAVFLRAVSLTALQSIIHEKSL